MHSSNVRNDADRKFLDSIPLGIINQFRNEMFLPSHINKNPTKFLNSDWIDIPSLREFLAAPEEHQPIDQTGTAQAETVVIVKHERTEEAPIKIKIEPGCERPALPHHIRTRTIHENGREAIEILDSDEELDTFDSIQDAECGELESESSVIDSTSDMDDSSIHADYSEHSLDCDFRLAPTDFEESDEWKESDTVWLDLGVRSLVSTFGPHRINRQVYGDRIERVQGLPSYYPVPQDDVGYLFDFRDPKYNSYVTADGLPMTPDAILKNKAINDQDSWKGPTGCNDRDVYLNVFNGEPIRCRSSRLQCSGFYACEGINKELLNIARYELDPASLDVVVQGQIKDRVQEGNSPEKRALTFFHLINKPTKACKAQDSEGAICQGYPVIKPHSNVQNGKTYFITCSEWTPMWRTHHSFRIPDNVDETLLARIFSQEGLDGFPSELVCSRLITAHVGGRIKSCQYPHNDTGAPTPMKKHKCRATRTIYIPRKTSLRMAFVLPNPKRPHNHHILPASKASLDIRERYAMAVRATGLVGSSVQSVGNAPSTQLILGTDNPALVAPALLNSRIRQDIIQKEKKVIFPHGTGLLGVSHLMLSELDKDPKDRYVRSMITSPTGGLAIFTMNKSLISLIHEADRFEVDTTFKRVHGEHKEWEVVIWSKAAQRAVTIARIYSNQATREHYKAIFDELQRLVHSLTGKRMLFKRLSRGGNLLTMGVDMELAQVLGAGDSFLSSNEADYSHILTTDISYFVQFFVRLCLTHAKRGVHDFKKLVSHADYTRIINFPYLKNETEIREFSDWIKELKIKKIQDWWDHKLKNVWILPAIIQCRSKIAIEDWYSTHSTTNIGEGQHNWSNRNTGINLSLAEAIITAHRLDAKVASEIEECLTSGILKNTRNSMASRMSRNVTRVNNAIEKGREVRESAKAANEAEEMVEKLKLVGKENREELKFWQAAAKASSTSKRKSNSSKAESNSSGRAAPPPVKSSKRKLGASVQDPTGDIKKARYTDIETPGSSFLSPNDINNGPPQVRNNMQLTDSMDSDFSPSLPSTQANDTSSGPQVINSMPVIAALPLVAASADIQDSAIPESTQVVESISAGIQLDVPRGPSASPTSCTQDPGSILLRPLEDCEQSFAMIYGSQDLSDFSSPVSSPQPTFRLAEAQFSWPRNYAAPEYEPYETPDSAPGAAPPGLHPESLLQGEVLPDLSLPVSPTATSSIGPSEGVYFGPGWNGGLGSDWSATDGVPMSFTELLEQ